MCTLILLSWTMALYSVEAGEDAAHDNAVQALLLRAINAHGGAEALGRIRADKAKFKGNLVVQGHTTPFLAEITVQLPSRYKHVIETNQGGDKHTIVEVINSDKIYIAVDGRAIEVDALQLAEIRAGLELQRAQRLLPLLEDKSYQLSALEDIKVNDRPAAGIRVSGRGRKEMRLYFDKEFALLVRADNFVEDGKGKQIRQNFFFGDFKDIGGYKRYTRVRAYRDSKQIMEAELLDAKALDKIDETEFA